MPQLVLCSPRPFPCLVRALACLSSLFTHSFDIFWLPLAIQSVLPDCHCWSQSSWGSYWSYAFRLSASACSPGSPNIPSLEVCSKSSLSSYCLFSPPLRAVLPQISSVCLTFYPHSFWGGLLHFFPVQSLSHVWLIVTPQTAVCQASLSVTNSWSLLKLMSTELVIWVKFRWWPTQWAWVWQAPGVGDITAWQIDGETVADFIFLGSKITADGDCSHEIKRRLLLLGRKVMTNLDNILKNRDILSPKVRLVKAMIFPVVMYGCECWTIKK